MIHRPLPERGDGGGRKQSCLRELNWVRHLLYSLLHQRLNQVMEADRVVGIGVVVSSGVEVQARCDEHQAGFG